MKAEDYFADVAPKKTKPIKAEDYFADVKVNKKPEELPRESTKNAERYSKLAGRAALEGISGIPGGLVTLGSALWNMPELLSGQSFPTVNTEQYGAKLADYFNLPKPEENERLPYAVAKGAAGAFGGAKLGQMLGGASKLSEFLGANAPVRTAIATGVGAGASEAAKQAELPAWAQIGAGLAGSVVPSVGMSMIKPTAQATGRLANSIMGNIEGVAGRVLNRQAGPEAATIADLLESGAVPNLRPIEGFAPRTSDIAGNAGISGLARFVQNSNIAPTELNNRIFTNAKAIKDYVNTAVGSEASLAKKEDFAEAIRDEILKPMRKRDLPVNTGNVVASIEQSLLQHKGNPTIQEALKAVLSKIPRQEGGDVWLGKNTLMLPNPKKDIGFNEVYNFKQYIDEALRGKYDDPASQAIKKAGTSLNQVRRELANSLTEAEPELKKYLKSQAIAQRQLKQSAAAEKLINQATIAAIAKNDETQQQTINMLRGESLRKALENKKTLKGLSENQIATLSNAQKALEASARISQGKALGSNTAQNLNLDRMIGDDVIRALSGADKSMTAGKLGKTFEIIDRSLSRITGRTEDLAAVLARAELEPAYAAKLMKKYKLSGPINLKTDAGRSALYSAMMASRNGQQ